MEAKTDETFVVSEENFDKLVSSGTPLEPEWDLPEQEELDEFTNQPGWIAQNPAHINGAYGLVGYYYQQGECRAPARLCCFFQFWYHCK